MTRRFSLVIVTIRGRAQALQDCLASIEQQTFRDFEAIVVDQGCDARVEAAVRSCAWARYIGVPPLGLSASRNRGIAEAYGALLVFPDDDAVLAPDFLERCDAEFRADPMLGLLSGCVVDPVTGRRTLRFPDAAANLTVWNVLRRHCSASIIVARSALRSEDIVFDPILGVGGSTPFGSGEETDLTFRLLMRGVRGRYDPAIVAYHPDTALATVSLQRVAYYARGTGACFRKLVAQFGWWPLGVLWIWTLVKSLGGSILDLVRWRPALFRLRFESFRMRIIGWVQYRAWIPR